MVVDTDGHTVDMAMVYEALTAERVTKVLTREKSGSNCSGINPFPARLCGTDT